MSASDFNGRLLAPVITLPRLPLSRSESTASCNIRFSFLTIISGALRSNSLLKRLFLLITRRYKSLRSDVANLPPSRGTKGLNSGGNTGRISRIIHSGLIPDFWNASSTFKRLAIFLIFASEPVSANSVLNVSISLFMLSDLSNSLIASAPMIAVNSSPNSSTFAR